MEYLPITVHLAEKKCLIVGGGQVALRKLEHLLHAGAKVDMIALQFEPGIVELAQQHPIELFKERFDEQDLQKYYLIVAATDDNELNKTISHKAQHAKVWVNVVDDLELSSFLMPAIIDRSPLLVAVSTGGVSPVLARIIREKIEWLLPKSLSGLLGKLKDFRPKIKKKYSTLKDKRGFSEWFIEQSIQQDITQYQDFDDLVSLYEGKYKQKGKVYLIGSGPGDPELLTLKALKIMQKADVVLHDALVSDDILSLVRKDAIKVNVGKRANKHSKHQQEINQLLIEYGQQDLSVVRLKGGDPFIYGRGGEELETLVEHSIEFEVVPGITAASGCATYAGIPLTHRDHSQTVLFITAHCKNSAQTLDWAMISKTHQTVAIYMGLLRNEEISTQMILNGRDPKTPVAIIENGTTAKQRVVTGSLDHLSDIVTKHYISSPALIIIGEVAQFATKLAWFKQSQLIISDEQDEQGIQEYQYQEAI